MIEITISRYIHDIMYKMNSVKRTYSIAIKVKRDTWCRRSNQNSLHVSPVWAVPVFYSPPIKIENVVGAFIHSSASKCGMTCDSIGAKSFRTEPLLGSQQFTAHNATDRGSNLYWRHGRCRFHRGFERRDHRRHVKSRTHSKDVAFGRIFSFLAPHL